MCAPLTTRGFWSRRASFCADASRSTSFPCATHEARYLYFCAFLPRALLCASLPVEGTGYHAACVACRYPSVQAHSSAYAPDRRSDDRLSSSVYESAQQRPHKTTYINSHNTMKHVALRLFGTVHWHAWKRIYSRQRRNIDDCKIALASRQANVRLPVKTTQPSQTHSERIRDQQKPATKKVN
jgi:hypothetical protein